MKDIALFCQCNKYGYYKLKTYKLKLNVILHRAKEKLPKKYLNLN